MSGRFAVVGAGVAGVACARALADAGWRVAIHEREPRIGGRLAQCHQEGAVFDYGGQFVRPRDPVLKALLEAGVAAGVAARWPAADRDGVAAYVGRPTMAAPLEALLHGIETRTGCQIVRLSRDGGSWWLEDEGGARHGPFDRVGLALPPVIAGQLLGTVEAPPEALVAATAAAALAPCWALLLAFDPPLDLHGFDARVIDEGPLAWIARNTTKRGRQGRDSWTAHATQDWSAAHLELSPEAVLEQLVPAFRAVTGTADVPFHAGAHCWRQAQVTRALGVAAVHDPGAGLGLCGDWCLSRNVEAAFLSGRALAGLLGEGG
ncbi:MAG: FAD-dependent oxidoreductase [Geminicoccaceae bacterium]|nr:FAD-dependent oxidoreductase [Geminicoccaceae bacterium]MCB9966547.1 FAD-dependent oxidoreductase [Geminicoccaceae bacterium]HRY24441.1 FAD-dependent oxidoreductase [Geminicoccaceae bacterium]